MYLLSLDLSSSCTGWSLWNRRKKSLLDYGIIKPKVKGVSKLVYPKKQLFILQNMAEQIKEIIEENNSKISTILIEEVNRGKNRIGQKALDGGHFILLDRIQDNIDLVVYKDSDGRTGWRKDLNLYLTQEDKKFNKEVKKQRKKGLIPPQKEITRKHLACRFVNKKYSTNFNIDINKSDSDVCDSIAMAHAYLNGPSNGTY